VEKIYPPPLAGLLCDETIADGNKVTLYQKLTLFCDNDRTFALSLYCLPHILRLLQN
jgi:hypothetical protein